MNPGEPLTLFLVIVASFSGAFLILPVLIKYTVTRNLVVEPGKRNIHTKNTPSLGGIPIFFGFLIALFFWIDLDSWVGGRYILGSLFIIFLLGVRDDLVPFSAWNKMIGQMAAIIVLLFSEVRINSLYGLFGVHEIPSWLGLIFTFLSLLIATNAYNLIDGLDGLAGTLGIIAYLSMGTWFYLAGQSAFALLCFSMIGGLLAFLVFNWEPADIFMGDSGAMVNGLILSIMLIQFMNTNEALPDANQLKYASTIGSAICFLIVPLSDTVRIIILRVSKGISPLTADKNHVHHGLVKLGFSHAKATLTLGLVTIVFIITGLLLRSAGDSTVIPVIIVASVILGVVLNRRLSRSGEQLTGLQQ